MEGSSPREWLIEEGARVRWRAGLWQAGRAIRRAGGDLGSSGHIREWRGIREWGGREAASGPEKGEHRSADGEHFRDRQTLEEKVCWGWSAGSDITTKGRVSLRRLMSRCTDVALNKPSCSNSVLFYCDWTLKGINESRIEISIVFIMQAP